MDIATAGRSLAAAYNIVAKSEFYISNSSDASYALTSSLSEGIVTMISGCQSVTVLRSGEAIPAGCVVSSVGDEVAIHLLVRGKVDIGQEISKIEDKISKVEQLKDGAVKRTQVPKYETVVPQSVREANASKISNYDAEIEVLQNSIKEFLVLKDGE
ncbi:valine--tRNA ligase [Coemansia sp. RSA 560]|nr:valine--tRNA ligase [Coemansia sp. RSA 560]